MGRPPCCDKDGIKKGPWTPEEDVVLVSYIQQHGPGNWRRVPTNTGLLRCSKSCRLRWTNYLRPGIKRGNFTPYEEGIIIHLQAQLGNKWSAIASYLPQRTDNDIKNYWNTHLKKKLMKAQSEASEILSKKTLQDFSVKSNNSIIKDSSHSQASTSYASSTENISRLLKSWMSSSSTTEESSTDPKSGNITIENNESNNSELCGKYKSRDLVSTEEVRSLEKHYESRDLPLTFLEKWLLDEANIINGDQVEEMHEMIMELEPVL